MLYGGCWSLRLHMVIANQEVNRFEVVDNWIFGLG